MSSTDAMIGRVCRTFEEHFAKDEATAHEQGKKYWIKRVLGSGATGTVLCAKRTQDGETFAVKVVDMEGMSEADKNRAQAEVHCLLNCDFFSILRCHEDFAKRDPQNEDNVLMIALVLDYANAGDLRQEIKSRAKRPDFSSRISSLLDSFTESRELISEALESVGTVYAAEDMEDARLQTEKTLMLWAELLKDLQESGDFAAVSRIEKEYGLKFAQLKEELENAEQAVGE